MFQQRKRVAVARSLANELEKDSPDLDVLQDIAINYGFGTFGHRKEVWAVLLSVPQGATPKPISSLIVHHKDSEQVDRDVDRSLYAFTSHLPDKKRKELRGELSDIINAVLSTHPELSYYQGFHDICSVMLLALGSVELGLVFTEQLCMRHIRHFMDPDFSETVQMMGLIVTLIGRLDPDVSEVILASEIHFQYAFSWVITWFAHDIDDFLVVAQIYDFLICSHPLMVLYLSAVVTVMKREAILAQAGNIDHVYKACCGIPDHFPHVQLMHKARALFRSYPPHEALRDANIHLKPTSRFTTFPFPNTPPTCIVRSRARKAKGEHPSGPDALTLYSMSNTSVAPQVTFFGLFSFLGIVSAYVFFGV